MQRNSKDNTYKRKGNKKKISLYELILPMGLLLLCLFVVIVISNKPDKKPLDIDTKTTSVSSLPIITSDKDTDLEGYSLLTKTYEDLSLGELVLINGDHAYKRNVKNELVSMFEYKSDCYSISNSTVIMRENVAIAFNDLLNTFYNKTGNYRINITSGYRSYELQKKLLDREIAQKGEDEASRWVASPGHSEHHSGYAVDINILGNNGIAEDYTGHGEYSILNKTAPEYGFIVRYPEDKKEITDIYYEPWHFRYVGLPHSKIMQDMNLCFEEYIDFLKQYTSVTKPFKYIYKGISYEIYYCYGYDVYVPDDKEYKVSGNNIDGFIVTVTATKTAEK